MKNYKNILLGSVMLVSLIGTPLALFAAPNGNGVNASGQASYNSNSSIHNWFWSRFFDRIGFRANVVNAQANGNSAKISSSTTNGNKSPVISGITAPTVLAAGSEGTWTVNASDPENGSLSYSVDWGDSGMLMGLKAFMSPAFVQTSTFNHTYDSQGTYKITFTVMDDAGKKTTSSVTVHVTKPKATLPVITNLVATSTNFTHGVITWNTDVKADSAIWLSTSSPVTTNRDPDWGKEGLRTNHKVKVNSLAPDTTYYIIVGSENEAGQAKSSETSFHTPAKVNKKAPVITSINASTTIAAGATEEVTINAYDPENGPLTYSVDWGDTMSIMKSALMTSEPPFVQTSSFSHVYDSAGVYTAKFTVKDEQGLTDSESVTITVLDASPDTTAPTWSNVNSVNAQATSTAGALVTFTKPTATDDIDGNLAVTCNPASGSNFAVGTSTVTCTAVDSSNNHATTTFSVIVSPKTAAPVISSAATTVASTTTTFTWMTNEPTNSKVYYGTTTPLNLGTALFLSNSSFVNSHSISFTPLATSTQYYFVIQSAASDGRVATTSQMSFTSGSGM